MSFHGVIYQWQVWLYPAKFGSIWLYHQSWKFGFCPRYLSACNSCCRGTVLSGLGIASVCLMGKWKSRRMVSWVRDSLVWIFFFLFLTFVQMQKLRCGDFVEFSFLNFMLSLLIVKFSLWVFVLYFEILKSIPPNACCYLLFLLCLSWTFESYAAEFVVWLIFLDWWMSALVAASF